MTQPRKGAGSGSKEPQQRATSSDGAGAAEGDGSVRDQLARMLSPLDAVVVTRERLQEIVDDAVQRGRMTRSDATDLVTDILSLGRRTTEEWLSEIDGRLGGPGERVRREVDRARRVTGLGPAFPISGYEQLTAAQVQARLGSLSPAELRKVRDYERRNANRKTVLAAIESRLG